MDCTVHGILQVRILEWVAFPFSRGSYQPRDQAQVSHTAGGFFTSWATREAQEYRSGEPITRETQSSGIMRHLLGCGSVVKLCRTLCDLMNNRLPCLSLSPEVCLNSCPLSSWCYLTISSSAALFPFGLQSFSASVSFPVLWLSASGGQSIRASASPLVLPMDIFRVDFL